MHRTMYVYCSCPPVGNVARAMLGLSMSMGYRNTDALGAFLRSRSSLVLVGIAREVATKGVPYGAHVFFVRERRTCHGRGCGKKHDRAFIAVVDKQPNCAREAGKNQRKQ